MIERSIAFGSQQHLVGTLCLPEGPGPFTVGQLLFNAGIVHRIGPHRLNVRLARRLAAHGVPSLRFDLSGLGDSRRPDSTLSHQAQSVADVRDACDALAAASGAKRFAALGFCSGARVLYAAWPEEPRLAGLVLYDGFAYPTPQSRLRLYRDRVRHLGLVPWLGKYAWRHTLGAARRLAHPSQDTAGMPATEPLARQPGRDEYAQRLLAMAAAGVKLGIVFSGEGENYNYGSQFADSMRGTGVMEKVQFQYLPRVDHTVTTLAMQSTFLDWMEGFALGLK